MTWNFIECERECLEDIAYRVIAMNERPDHSTIARFVARPEEALAGVFSSVLKVCAQAGLVNVSVIAVDGSKLPAAVNEEQTLDFEQIARQVLAEAKALGAAEDELYGDRRGDELPPELATSEGRKAWLAQAMRELADEQADQAAVEDPVDGEAGEPAAFELALGNEGQLVASNQSRRGWLREARRQLEQHRAQHPRPVPRSRKGRLLEGCDSWMRSSMPSAKRTRRMRRTGRAGG